MWKIISSSNLNSLLKLFFYSSILANNNLLLKIYCKNIMVTFLNGIFHFFLSFYHPYISFSFSFSFLLIFLHHTRIPIISILSFSFLSFFSTFHFILEPPSLFLFLALCMELQEHFLFLFFSFLFFSSSTSAGAVSHT